MHSGDRVGLGPLDVRSGLVQSCQQFPQPLLVRLDSPQHAARGADPVVEPRTEHVRDGSGDYWEVRGKSGLLTQYGTPRPAGADATWRDPAVVADPANPGRVFGWLATETRDPLGNLIRYEYLRDHGHEPGHTWDQPLLSRISYADYGDPAAPSFLVQVDFEYEPRPDAFSQYRSGFEVRTSLRCRTRKIVTISPGSLVRRRRRTCCRTPLGVVPNCSLLPARSIKPVMVSSRFRWL